MINTGDNAYLVREPVIKDNEVTGHLYGEYLFERLAEWMPWEEKAMGSDYSVMKAADMHYVYTPMTRMAGTHINFNRLEDYLQNKEEAASMMKEIHAAIQKNEYYMRIVTMKNLYDKENAIDYVLFLWPIDDGVLSFKFCKN